MENKPNLKVFLPVYPGLKSEILRPKTFKKTLFMHLRPRLKSLEKKLLA
jgi:hypothetical protein